MKKQLKLGIGSASAGLGALGFFLSMVLNWSDIAAPWDFLLGFLWGILMGIGVALSIAGLLEKSDP